MPLRRRGHNNVNYSCFCPPPGDSRLSRRGTRGPLQPGAFAHSAHPIVTPLSRPSRRGWAPCACVRACVQSCGSPTQDGTRARRRARPASRRRRRRWSSRRRPTTTSSSVARPSRRRTRARRPNRPSATSARPASDSRGHRTPTTARPSSPPSWSNTSRPTPARSGLASTSQLFL